MIEVSHLFLLGYKFATGGDLVATTPGMKRACEHRALPKHHPGHCWQQGYILELKPSGVGIS